MIYKKEQLKIGKKVSKKIVRYFQIPIVVVRKLIKNAYSKIYHFFLKNQKFQTFIQSSYLNWTLYMMHHQNILRNYKKEFEDISRTFYKFSPKIQKELQICIIIWLIFRMVTNFPVLNQKSLINLPVYFLKLQELSHKIAQEIFKKYPKPAYPFYNFNPKIP